MINNDVQYKVSMRALNKFRKALNQSIDEGPREYDPVLFIALLQSLRSQIIELENLTEEYMRQVNLGFLN